MKSGVNPTDLATSRDAFAGGLVAGIVEGKPLDESIDMGHWLASLGIKELGAQYVASCTLNNLICSLLLVAHRYTHHLHRPFGVSHSIIDSNILRTSKLTFTLLNRYPSPKQTYQPISK